MQKKQTETYKYYKSETHKRFMTCGAIVKMKF